ncbi:ArnT family glycosyltransferase [Massilia yuzhufengensis]|uniref:Phosphoglycerol transferase n=1 Tax=Massilia yuzhufengensis TaxID=1164594 RepID=A0A1I1VRK9_9BURK|nr:hypothetical protein [Massilia yuzhufengensis]SFD85677.1 phosphoglycerol transferase [Massilia yuzhufengensis]
MTPHDTSLRRDPWALALPFALACIAWFLYQRNFGLQPTVFADEWYYSKMARLMPLQEAIVPSYLYLWIFGASTSCGEGFLECVRAGNLAFFLAAAPFVYLVTRRYAGSLAAFCVAVFTALAPLNVYTAYFMPESTYYFGFWVLTWVALARASWHPLLHALVLGAILGAMSLVKVHALFLIPALCLYLVYASWQRGGSWFLRGVATAAAAGVFTVVVKFALGWLLAGDAGLSLLGPFYQGAVNAGGKGSRLALLNPAFINGRGQLMALAVVYGVPLAILAYELCARVLRRRAAATGAGPATPDPRNLLHVYTLLTLGAAAGMTIMYTATLDQPGSREILRLHLRYYSFVFPLLVIVAAAAIGRRDSDRGATDDAGLPALRWAIALLLCGVLVFALSRLPGYALNIVDGPEIAAIDLALPAGRLLVALQCALLLAWAARVRGTALVYLFVALPAALVAGNDGTSGFLARHAPPGQGDLAGRLAHSRVAPADRKDVVVAGTDMTVIMRVQFHLDDKDSIPLLLEPNTPMAEYQVPANKKWMVLVGDVPLPASVHPVVRTPHYSLVRLPDPEPAVVTIKMSEQPDPVSVSGIEGLSHAELWGRWSDAKRVVIHFAKPLPRRAGVVLNARGYDVNATLPFTAHIGDVSKEFRVGWNLQQVGMHFDTDGQQRTLVIDIPRPISPAELGNPGDPRKLGIGIAELVITDGATAAQAAR